jgi:hypothetical protein
VCGLLAPSRGVREVRAPALDPVPTGAGDDCPRRVTGAGNGDFLLFASDADLCEQSSVAHATQAQPFRTECFTPLFTNVASDPFGSHHGQDSPRPLPAVQTNSLFSDSDSVVELGARATRQLTIGRERAHRLEAPPTSVLASGADKWGISDGPAVFRLYKSPEPSIIPGVEKETSLICEPVAIEYRISAASHDKDCDSDDIRGLGIPRSDGSSPPPNTRRSSIQDEFPPLDIFDFCSFPDRSKLQRPSAPEVESDIASAQEDLDGMSSCAGDDERSSSTCSSDNSEVPPLRFRQSTQDRARAVRAGSVTGGLPTCGNVGDRGSAA